MTQDSIAILMPGDMGSGVGRALREHGLDVVTSLAGRSDRSRGLAAAAGMRDAGRLQDTVVAADLVLSILPPAQAVAQAEAVAAAMAATGARPVYVDCNAVSPATARKVGAIIAGAGAPFLDCGIIGLPPGKSPETRFHVAGPDTAPMRRLHGKGISVIPMGPEIGRASALKMVYAGLTKGTWTLHTALLLGAWRMGVYDELIAEYENSQGAALKAMRDRVPRLPTDAGRWVGEMEEIAASLADAGVPSGFHEAAAEIFRTVDRTPFSSETRETVDLTRTLDHAIAAYAAYLKPHEG
jgi:3-hydroxyisobutyrate dehydrogenase-like beta-hydroxyacid dehydrogenase